MTSASLDESNFYVSLRTSKGAECSGYYLEGHPRLGDVLYDVLHPLDLTILFRDARRQIRSLNESIVSKLFSSQRTHGHQC